MLGSQALPITFDLCEIVSQRVPRAVSGAYLDPWTRLAPVLDRVPTFVGGYAELYVLGLRKTVNMRETDSSRVQNAGGRVLRESPGPLRERIYMLLDAMRPVRAVFSDVCDGPRFTCAGSAGRKRSTCVAQVRV